MGRVCDDPGVERPDVGFARDGLVPERVAEMVVRPEVVDQQTTVVTLEMALERRGEPAGLLDRLGQQSDHRVAERIRPIDDGVAMGAELAVGTDQAGRRIDDRGVVVGDLTLEPRPVALDKIGGIGGAQGGQEQWQRVDAVFEDITGAIEVVDRRRDVAASPRPDVERVGERVA